MQDPFGKPADERWFEDYPVGLESEWGTAVIDAAEIVEFARKYDPQYFHTDPERAASGPFGGLAASGWNTVGLMMRLLVTHFLPGRASLGSPGIDEIRFLKPVYPGDALRIRVRVLEARRSASRPSMGVVRSLIEVLNQSDAVVLSMKAATMIAVRPG